MPQNPLNTFVAKSPSGAAVAIACDVEGALLTAGASSATLNITAPTVVKTKPGLVFRVTIVVAGSAAGTINDCITTGAAAASNTICVTPNTVSTINLEWPTALGIVVVPGTGQTLAVSYT